MLHQRVHIRLGGRRWRLSANPEDRFDGFHDAGLLELAMGDQTAMEALRRLHHDHHPGATMAPIPDDEVIRQVGGLLQTGRICMIADGQFDSYVAPFEPRYSGSAWWHAHEGKYPNSTSIDDLSDLFRPRVRAFVDALEEAGAMVQVEATRRDKIRAFLMHYAWLVAHGGILPKKVPKRDGLSIIWDHGNLKASKKAAMEMVKLFEMAHIAALSSNHIAGNAIDMSITWSGTLEVKNAKGKVVKVKAPRNGGKNTTLHAVGASYKVYKLVKDPPDDPHWSHNGG
ncbi:hypothetical protein JYK14_04060 [Siccirubricoccus sp. KC 17139]|uniref:Uncharacterized protein n=1 Tax=Siccirubricoccus soli TaxID=2899147 RepID=A0ABT1D119_9PROT|nr:hypothetical protein [Siccirubricoccus soli]MCO6415352.1 hypothetical protein [Siccirubricoccus soli]MCP2681484.1 hypothetical protein [Siccirubricoccus soli]